jgi:hypothetical protein
VNKLEQLAAELAFLSNDSIVELAQILVRDYPTRADVLETQLGAQFFDQQTKVNYHYE